MTNSFSVNQSVVDGYSVLSLDGFLDAHTAPVFEAAIQQEVEAGRLRIIVECAGLTYISSAGLGVFMSFIEEIREKGGDLKICGIIPKVRQVFEILGFPALFDIVDNISDARGRFEKPPEEEK